LPDGSDGAFKTMMAKLLSQKLHRTVHAVVGCKHLGECSGDSNLSGTP
jgi:AAA+ superfamily predicted ATPase